jgi:cobalt/nickel transport system permease protein
VPKLANGIHELYALESLAEGDSPVHRLHPTVKLTTALFFVIVVASFGRYDFGRLLPYLFYPAVLMALSGTPYGMLLKRFCVALPFCLFAGGANLFFDGETAFPLFGIPVSFGFVSFATVLLKAWLCVMAVLLLVSTTRFSELTRALLRLRVPSIFVTVLEMTYRYVGVLWEEARIMYAAYALRGGARGRRGGVEMRHMGGFLGSLLLRGFDRAERIYRAMKCRGYGAAPTASSKKRALAPRDFVCAAAVFLSCPSLRFVRVDALFNALWIEWFA